MKKLFYAGAAMIAVAAMAPAAQAAVTIDLTSVSSTSFNSPSLATPISLLLPTGMFKVTLSVTSVTLGSFTGFDLDTFAQAATTYTVPGVLVGIGSVFNSAGGSHSLSFYGTGAGSFGGDISIAAIPEPATWAMMIAGIAAVGLTMRRRAALQSVSFS